MAASDVSQSSGETQTIARKRNRAQGRKQAFAIESIAKIKTHLIERNDRRGLALLLTSLDTCLRSCDLLSLRVSDVVDHNMQVVERFEFRQAKTNRNVMCSLTPTTREALRDLISVQNKGVTDYLWTAKAAFHGAAISKVLFRRIVKGWAVVA